MWSGLHTPTSGAQKSVFQNVMGNTTAICSQCHGQHVREAIGRAQYDVEGPPSRRGTYMAHRTQCGTYMASLRVPGFQRDDAYTRLHALRQRHSLNRYFDSFVPSRRHRPQGLLNNEETIGEPPALKSLVTPNAIGGAGGLLVLIFGYNRATA